MPEARVRFSFRCCPDAKMTTGGRGPIASRLSSSRASDSPGARCPQRVTREVDGASDRPNLGERLRDRLDLRDEDPVGPSAPKDWRLVRFDLARDRTRECVSRNSREATHAAQWRRGWPSAIGRSP